MNGGQSSLDHVSVVMPAYNAEKYISEAFTSVMNQGHRDWDLIIIDDGSSDRTFELAMELSQNDDRINVQKNSKNHGVTYSRNRGIKVAKGPWVAFLDSDDMWRREKLSSQLELAHALDGASFLFTGTAYMNEAGDISSYALRPPETVCFRDLLAQNPITCSSVLIRKDLLKDDAAAHDGLHEDYAMWLSVLKGEQRAYAVSQPLTLHRMAAGSKSSNKMQAARMNYKTLRHVGVSRLVALIKMMQYATRNFRKYSAIYKGFIQEGNES